MTTQTPTTIRRNISTNDLNRLNSNPIGMRAFLYQTMIQSEGATFDDVTGARIEYIDESGAVVIAVDWASTHADIRAQIEQERDEFTAQGC
jgi:hypothetical protein